MAPKKEKSPHKPRNYVLGGSGVMRFSQARMYQKRAVYKKKKPKAAKTKKETLTRFVKKDIGGDKNGGFRMVRVSKLPKSYPTQEASRNLKTRKVPFKAHNRKLRPSLTPGTILIMVAGRHRGKRVVFLKQLASGLLLVTGPYHLNGCPLRRINQQYVIATKTKLDVSGVKLPERVNDDYFKRTKLRKPKHTEGEIFDTKKEVYKVSDERKADQVDVDKQVLDAIRKNSEKKYLFGYLGAMFSLEGKNYPHNMVF
ncbi:unnamed protein product [Owenia fusiformis]|uniref:Large ribosomal subunit protein eL6 n=1 Tax=Owenia fusiformis TaxID=6347 RepID=A0A8J1UYQ0_OWEFU|nr:unnamed protein product [Owenia fusiformis]